MFPLAVAQDLPLRTSPIGSMKRQQFLLVHRGKRSAQKRQSCLPDYNERKRLFDTLLNVATKNATFHHFHQLSRLRFHTTCNTVRILPPILLQCIASLRWPHSRPRRSAVLDVASKLDEFPLAHTRPIIAHCHVGFGNVWYPPHNSVCACKFRPKLRGFCKRRPMGRHETERRRTGV